MIDEPLSVPLDRTTVLFLVELAKVLANEPTVPNLDVHDGHHLHEIAMRHYDWERQVGALRLLLGVRLTNAALDIWEEVHT